MRLFGPVNPGIFKNESLIDNVYFIANLNRMFQGTSNGTFIYTLYQNCAPAENSSTVMLVLC